MDSESIRNQVRNLRQFKFSDSDRSYIRNHAGGTSKFFSSIIREKFLEIKEFNKTAEHVGDTDSANEWAYEVSRNRNRVFLNIARTWTEQSLSESTENPVGEIEPRWHKKYLDDDLNRAVLKVNSHQLDRFGTTINRNPRYNQLVPNLALLSANHHADIGADIAINTLQHHPSMIRDANILHNP